MVDSGALAALSRCLEAFDPQVKEAAASAIGTVSKGYTVPLPAHSLLSPARAALLDLLCVMDPSVYIGFLFCPHILQNLYFLVTVRLPASLSTRLHCSPFRGPRFFCSCCGHCSASRPMHSRARTKYQEECGISSCRYCKTLTRIGTGEGSIPAELKDAKTRRFTCATKDDRQFKSED